MKSIGSIVQIDWTTVGQPGQTPQGIELLAPEKRLYYNGLLGLRRDRLTEAATDEWPRDGNWTPDDVLRLARRQADKIAELRDQLRDTQSALYRTEAELREAREKLGREGQMRPAIEVLRRMANGLDPYDDGRFKCAVAALPHETPKLSATVSVFGNLGIGDRLDARKRERELRVIEGGDNAA